MALEEEYLEYAITIILTTIGISSTFFINLSNKFSLALLMFLPILYGHTAYISSEGFNKASVFSLIALIFSVTGGLTALMSIIYGVGNVLVSVFAGGSRTRDYYGSVSMPLLITGLIIGVSIYGYASIDEDFKDKKIDEASEEIAGMSQNALESTKLAERQKRQQLQFVNETSRSAVVLTAEKVVNESEPSDEVREVLEKARDDVPNTMYQKTLNKIKEKNPRTQKRLSETIERSLNSNMFITIPLSALFLITLQPLIGLTTALSATIFSKIFS